MTVPLRQLTLASARDGLLGGEFSAGELMEASLAAMAAARPLNAMITETGREEAIGQARESDRRIRAGRARPLEGLPFVHKDLFCTAGVRTTAGSNMLRDFVPPFSSVVGLKLEEAGAISLGKGNLDEFAMGASTRTSAFGPAINPWRDGEGRHLTPGGSSGGSAAAVASFALAATGTDTGGSIRQPASLCGVFGVKPTYGRCSRRGIIAFASSLDQAGVIARSVRDCAMMLRVMAGFDPLDSTSARQPVPPWDELLSPDVRGLKFGIPREYRLPGAPPALLDLWAQGSEWLAQAGAEPVEISIPFTREALPVYYIIAPAEASSNLARYDGIRYGLRAGAGEGGTDALYARTRGRGFGPEVRRRILIGTHVLSGGYYDAYYNRAQAVRRLLADAFRSALDRVDVLLVPTAPDEAFPVDRPLSPVGMYMNDVFTVPASLAGLPAMSVPAGWSDNRLPLGLQLVARPFDEETLFRAAAALALAAGPRELPEPWWENGT